MSSHRLIVEKAKHRIKHMQEERQVHIPVLLQEVLEIFEPKSGDTFIDATVNGGGHARAILESVGLKGHVLGIDWDCSLINTLNVEISKLKITNFKTVCDTYVNVRNIAREYHLESLAGILFDCGFSSYHVEGAQRGFSFLRDEALDMRYNVDRTTLTAAEIVNRWHEGDLEKIIRTYGGERYARKIANAIVEARRQKKIATTDALVKVIRSAVPQRYAKGRIHSATRTFQALRIVVNNELVNLQKGLEEAATLLQSSKGILAVITFHSLEDRIAKNFFKTAASQKRMNILTKKPLLPTRNEIKNNPRARSAKLRAGKMIQ